MKAYQAHACGGRIPCESMGRVAVAGKSWVMVFETLKSVLSLDRSRQVPGPTAVTVKRDPLSAKSSFGCEPDQIDEGVD